MNGLLYGTTVAGGKACGDGGCGTIFSFNPQTKQEALLHGFQPYYEGASGNGLIAAEGSLYGTTFIGGEAGNDGGTLFKVDPATGNLIVLFAFDDERETGANPNAAPIYDNGILYGTTDNGGAYYSGVVYRFDLATSVETVLHGFNSTDGQIPNALVFHDGALYGSTIYGAGSGCLNIGCGEVFKIDPKTGSFKILHAFAGQPDGAYPMGVTFHNGKIYGVTEFGGASNHGLLYSIDPTTGVETPLYSFHGGPQPPFPNSPITFNGGALYGTSGRRAIYKNSCRGNGHGCGAVFKYDLNTAQMSVLYHFIGKDDGGIPVGGVVDDAGRLYGTTELRGGPGCNASNHNHVGCGTLFQITP